MTPTQAIKEIQAIQARIKTYPQKKGRSSLINKTEAAIRHLISYKIDVSDNTHVMMVREIEREFKKFNELYGDPEKKQSAK